jgi:hypothetical protein
MIDIDFNRFIFLSDTYKIVSCFSTAPFVVVDIKNEGSPVKFDCPLKTQWESLAHPL